MFLEYLAIPTGKSRAFSVRNMGWYHSLRAEVPMGLTESRIYGTQKNEADILSKRPEWLGMLSKRERINEKACVRN